MSIKDILFLDVSCMIHGQQIVTTETRKMRVIMPDPVCLPSPSKICSWKNAEVIARQKMLTDRWLHPKSVDFCLLISPSCVSNMQHMDLN